MHRAALGAGRPEGEGDSALRVLEHTHAPTCPQAQAHVGAYRARVYACVYAHVVHVCVYTSVVYVCACNQLLGLVVREERPDLEKQKNNLIKSLAADKKQLQDLENKILKLVRARMGIRSSCCARTHTPNALGLCVCCLTLSRSRVLSNLTLPALRVDGQHSRR